MNLDDRAFRSDAAPSPWPQSDFLAAEHRSALVQNLWAGVGAAWAPPLTPCLLL